MKQGHIKTMAGNSIKGNDAPSEKLPDKKSDKWSGHRSKVKSDLTAKVTLNEGPGFGALIICPTPIGNLKDITLRALDELAAADLILAEDTRRTLKLLNHFKIKKSIMSFNLASEHKALPKAIAEMLSGKRVVLVTDAGTPAIADPGYLLVKAARSRDISVISLPGPCAFITALAGSGLPTESFLFMGFLPRKRDKLRAELIRLANMDETIAIYESPHRIKKLLTEIADIMPDRNVAVARELTKLYEEYSFGSASEILSRVPEKPLGEYVVLIERSATKGTDDAAARTKKAFDILAGLDTSLTAKEKRDILVKELGLKKNEAYNIALGTQNSENRLESKR